MKTVVKDSSERRTSGQRRSDNPEMHLLKFSVPDAMHGDLKVEVQITIGFYGTSSTLIINDHVVAQTLDEKWNNGPK